MAYRYRKKKKITIKNFAETQSFLDYGIEKKCCIEIHPVRSYGFSAASPEWGFCCPPHVRMYAEMLFYNSSWSTNNEKQVVLGSKR